MPLPLVVVAAGGLTVGAGIGLALSGDRAGTEEGADTIPEATGDREQCYLLNGCLEIRNQFSIKREHLPIRPEHKFFPNNRICMVEDEHPEIWLNQMSYPNEASELFNSPSITYNYTDFDFYIMKKDSSGKLQKIDVKKGFNGGETASGNSSPSKKTIESINISYKGTTPASARSDINVKISIKVDADLSALSQNINSIDINSNSSANFNLLDVIIRPEFLRDGEGLSSWKRSQFHPDYNRTELVIHNYFNESLSFNYDNGNLINEGGWSHSTSFALTMVDHELSINEGGEGFTVTLTYQSYVEQVIGLPYTDVFASAEITKNRRAREKQISAAHQSGDKDKIKNAKDNNKEKNKIEIEQGKKRIMQRITDTDLWFVATLNEGQTIPKVQSSFDGRAVNEIISLKEATNRGLETGNYVKFVYLADLIGIAMDIFFTKQWQGGVEDTSGEEYEADFKDKLEIKTMFLNINLPDQNPIMEKGGDNYTQVGLTENSTLNLGMLPISKDFLDKFLEDNYVKKGLNFAPFQSFVRNLCEKAITKAISKVCFLDSDWKGKIKVDFFKALDETWEKVYDYHEQFGTATLLSGKKLNEIFNGKYGSIDPKKEKEYTTYMVIHASEQAETSNLVNLALQDEEGKPFLILKDKVSQISDDNKESKNVNLYGNSLGTTFNFKRVDNKYRREAVYTEFKSNAFVAIGNVYSATVNFKSACCNWFFPGNLLILDPFDGDVNKSWNNAEKIGNRLGITGIYLVKSVTHDLKFGKEKSFSTKLEANWETSAIGDLRKESDNTDPTTPPKQDTVGGAKIIKNANQIPKSKNKQNKDKINKGQQGKLNGVTSGRKKSSGG